MKAIILNVLFLVASATLASAGTSPLIQITESANTKKVSVVLEGLSAPATITIEDANGEVLIEEKAKGKFAKSFNLNRLPQGEYRLVVNTGMVETVQPLSLTKEIVVLTEAARYEVYAPAINVNENFVDLSFLNNRFGNVYVVFLDKNGDVVYEENIQNALKVEKRYDLSRLPKGDYSVRVVVGRGDYTTAVALR